MPHAPTGVARNSGDAPTFDLNALHAAVEAARLERGLSRTALARSAGVAAPTIARFAHGDPATTEADGVLAVVRWLGAPPERFVRPAPGVPGLLLDAAAPMVRVDTAAMGLGSGSRTNIAVLTTVAHRLGVPIAALTRRSDW